MTEYEYDADGRLVRAVTIHDPRFTDDDTQAALERTEEQAMVCPGGCGHRRDEAWPRDREHGLEIDGMFYIDHVTCAACAARDRDAKRSKDMAAGTFPVVRRRDES